MIFITQCLSFFCLCFSYALADASTGNHLIYVIRHGEKVGSIGNLSDLGIERANALPSIFNGKPSSGNQQFEIPQSLFANLYADIDGERCIETLQPISDHLKLPLNSSYSFHPRYGGNSLAAHAMLSSIAKGPVLVAWEHVNIQFLVHFLGVSKELIPFWPDDDYDTVYILQYNEQRELLKFDISAENFVPAMSKY